MKPQAKTAIAAFAILFAVNVKSSSADTECCQDLQKRIEKLELQVAEQAKQLSACSAQASRSVTTRDVNVPSSELNKALTNLPQYMSEFRSVPYFRGGRMVGVRFFAIRRGSLLESYGLKNGDILLAIDGKPVDSPVNVGELLVKRDPAKKLELRIERLAEEQIITVQSKKE